ncbi:hypothetical protein ACRRTK_019290 [Alexandromys fortis]
MFFPLYKDTNKATLTALVIGNGSCMSKGGFAANKLPRAVFSSIVVCPQYHSVIVSKEQKVSYVDDSAKA